MSKKGYLVVTWVELSDVGKIQRLYVNNAAIYYLFCRCHAFCFFQELESLGEDAIPFVSFQQPAEEEEETCTGEDGTGGASSSTDAVGIEGIDLAGSNISKEALPVIEETEK